MIQNTFEFLKFDVAKIHVAIDLKLILLQMWIWMKVEVGVSFQVYDSNLQRKSGHSEDFLCD